MRKRGSCRVEKDPRLRRDYELDTGNPAPSFDPWTKGRFFAILAAMNTSDAATPLSPAQAALPVYDLFVIGGGINGVGIARDAAGRGLKVFLCEKGDLAQGTSSASTKLIHGGLRYLEFYEFRLVRKALKEREVLLRSAPNIIWPMEFVLPHQESLRPAWMIRLGLWIYDHLATHKNLPESYAVNLRESRFGKKLKPYLKSGFVYSDCWVEDSRLVTMSAIDALQHSAEIHTYTDFVRAEKFPDKLWHIDVKKGDGMTRSILARHIVNAAGPGLSKVAKLIVGYPEQARPLRLVRGSHIVVPRPYEGEHAYLLQHSDRRMVFVIPFEDDFILIGTTDKPADEAEVANPKISEEEIDYLLDAVNLHFVDKLTRDDVKYTYSGIRPLFDDGSTDASRVTRDYHLTLENDILSVFGGKITTFRKLAEEAVDMILASRGESAPHWTDKAILPGGDIEGSLAEFTQHVLEQYSFLPESLATRLASHYGTRLHLFLQYATSLTDLGEDFGHGLYAREIDFLCDYEWARTPDDILFRRTKMGLRVSEDTKEKLAAYLKKRGF